MRINRFVDDEGRTHLGRDRQDGTAEILRGGLFDGLEPSGDTRRVDRLLAPLTPPDVFCVGLNYRGHAAESGMAIPKTPIVFMKPTSAVIGPGQAIVVPSVCADDEVDYECELAVVIGKTACNVPAERALDHVLGYTCANDVSARKWQLKRGGGQWIRGKGFRTFCPIGPAIVTADEIADPGDLTVRTTLNGRTMQEGTTSDLVFDVAALIGFLSQDTVLLPGTLILTGTPQGVGMSRTPPVWLKAGDEVVVEVEKVGRLVNPVTGP